MKSSAEFIATCDRCKRYKDTCLIVPYAVPPLLTPPPTEPLIGAGYIIERQVVDLEDIRIPTAAMCRECRELKGLVW